jgi:hypothetical protein
VYRNIKENWKFTKIFRLRFVRLQRKMKKAVEILEFFTTNQWHFSNENVFSLMHQLNDTDTEVG